MGGSDVLVDVLNAARTHRCSPAITDASGTMTYGELFALVLGTAHRLRDNGFQPGDRLLFALQPSARSTAFALGVVAAGGTVVVGDSCDRPELARPTWAAAGSWSYVRGHPRAARHVRSGPWLPGVPRGALSIKDVVRPVSFNEFPSRSPDQEAFVVFAPDAIVHTRGSLGARLRTSGRLDPVHSDLLAVGLPALISGGQWTVPAT